MTIRKRRLKEIIGQSAHRVVILLLGALFGGDPLCWRARVGESFHWRVPHRAHWLLDWCRRDAQFLRWRLLGKHLGWNCWNPSALSRVNWWAWALVPHLQVALVLQHSCVCRVLQCDAFSAFLVHLKLVFSCQLENRLFQLICHRLSPLIDVHSCGGSFAMWSFAFLSWLHDSQIVCVRVEVSLTAAQLLRFKQSSMTIALKLIDWCFAPVVFHHFTCAL